MNSKKGIYEKLIRNYENSTNFIECLLERKYKIKLGDKTIKNNTKNISDKDLNSETSILKENDGYCEYITDEDNNPVKLEDIKKIYDEFDLDLSQKSCQNKFLKIKLDEDTTYYAIPYLRKIDAGNLFFNETEQKKYNDDDLARIIKKYVTPEINIDNQTLELYMEADEILKKELEEQYKELKRADINFIRKYVNSEIEERKKLEKEHKELYSIGIEISKESFLKYYFEETGSIIFSIKNNVPDLNEINHIGLNEFKELAVGSLSYDTTSMLILEESESVELFKNLIIANQNKEDNEMDNLLEINQEANSICKPSKLNSTSYITYDYKTKEIRLTTDYDISKVNDRDNNRIMEKDDEGNSTIVFTNIGDFFENGDNYIKSIENQSFDKVSHAIRDFNSKLLSQTEEVDSAIRSEFDDLILQKIKEELKEIESGDFSNKKYLPQEKLEVLQEKIKEDGIDKVLDEDYFNKHLINSCYKILKMHESYESKLHKGKIELNDLFDVYKEAYINDITSSDGYKFLNQQDTILNKKEVISENIKDFNLDIYNHVIKISELEELFDLNNSMLRDDIILGYLKSDDEFDTETKKLEELKKFYKKVSYNLDESVPEDNQKIKLLEREFLTLLNKSINEENTTLSEIIYDTNRKNFNKFIQNKNKPLEEKFDLVLNNIDRDSIIYAKGDLIEVSIKKVDNNNFELSSKFGIFENKINCEKEKVLEYLKSFKEESLLKSLELNIDKKHSIYNAGNLLEKYHDNDVAIVAERNDKNSPYKEEFESAGGYNDVNKYLNRISRGETCIIKKTMDKRNEEEFFLIKRELSDKGDNIYILSIRANKNTEFKEIERKLNDKDKFTVTTKAVSLSELKTFVENKTDRSHHISCKDYEYSVSNFIKNDKVAIKTLGKIAYNSSFIDKEEVLTARINEYIKNCKAAIFVTGDKDEEQRKMFKFEENSKGSVDLKVIVLPKTTDGIPYTMTFENALEYSKLSSGPVLNISDKYKSGNNLFKNCFNDLLTSEDQIDKLRLKYTSYQDKERRDGLTTHLSDNFNLLYTGSKNHGLNKEYYETNGYTDLHEKTKDGGITKVELSGEELDLIDINYGKSMEVKSFEDFDDPSAKNHFDRNMCMAYNNSYMTKFRQIVTADNFNEYLSYTVSSELRDSLDTIYKESEAEIFTQL